MDAPFHCLAYYYFHADWNSFYDHLRVATLFFKLQLLLLLLNFVGGPRLELMHKSHCKYQVKPHSSPCFSAATNRLNLLHLKWSSDRLAIGAKGLLKLQNLHILITQNNLLLPRNLTLVTFGGLLIVFFSKGKSATPPFFNVPEVLSSSSDKANLLMTHKSPYHFPF